MNITMMLIMFLPMLLVIFLLNRSQGKKQKDLESKLKRIDELLSFDRTLSERFDMPPERHDKYHRCASFFA